MSDDFEGTEVGAKEAAEIMKRSSRRAIPAMPSPPAAATAQASEYRDLSPKGWVAGVKFVSKYRDYRLVVVPDSHVVVDGVRVKTRGFTAEFKAREFSPKSEDDYNRIATKWRDMYGHMNPQAPNSYNFFELRPGDVPEAFVAPKQAEQFVKKEEIKVVTGARTTAAVDMTTR